jgi:hypothetical protein
MMKNYIGHEFTAMETNLKIETAPLNWALLAKLNSVRFSMQYVKLYAIVILTTFIVSKDKPATVSVSG